MRILADECCDAQLVAALRQDGHDVRYISESDKGSKDRQVRELAYADQRLLLTIDKDFGELIVRLKELSHGVLLIRIDDTDVDLQIRRLRQTIQTFGDTLIMHFTVVGPQKTRHRSLSLKGSG